MWPNPQETTDLVTFTEEILNGKLHFLCSVNYMKLAFIMILYKTINCLQKIAHEIFCLQRPLTFQIFQEK